MNVFGFLSTIIICATIIVVTWFMFNKTLNIKVTKAEEQPKPPVFVTNPVDADEARKKLEEEINKDRPIISMDSVIRSANEMMGIETLSDEEDKANG